VVDEHNVVLAGNASREAALEAGIRKVVVIDQDAAALTVVRRTGLSPAQKQKLALGDNRAGEFSSYDPDVLRAMKDEGVDMSALFTPDQWAKAVHAGDESQADKDARATALSRRTAHDIGDRRCATSSTPSRSRQSRRLCWNSSCVSGRTRSARRSARASPSWTPSARWWRQAHEAQDQDRSLADLTQDPDNARLHSAENRSMIERSLKTCGPARPIVTDEDGVILAGNATQIAALKSGIANAHVIDVDGETLVAVRVSGLTDVQKMELAMFDNRSADLGAWMSSG